MKKFNKEELLKSNTVIHCKTQEQWDSLVDYGKESIVDWSVGKDEWEEYTSEACLNVKQGLYRDVEFYSKEKYTILPYEEIVDNEVEPKSDIYVTNVGDFDQQELLFFVENLLDKGYKIELNMTGKMYELKGDK